MREVFLGVPVDALTLEETVNKARDAMRLRQKLRQVSLNVAKFVSMKTDAQLRNDVFSSDIISVDGMGILFAGRLLDVHIPERVAGVDVMERLFAVCATEGFKPFLLGARETVLAEAMSNLQSTFPKLEIAGSQHGYYPRESEPDIADAINRSGADCLFIGMPTPYKERFLALYANRLDVPFIMGVGGGIDIIAGYTKRAPRWIQNAGLEWLFRLVQEPRKLWKRYLTTNAQFMVILGEQLLKQHLRARVGGPIL